MVKARGIRSASMHTGVKVGAYRGIIRNDACETSSAHQRLTPTHPWAPPGGGLCCGYVGAAPAHGESPDRRLPTLCRVLVLRASPLSTPSDGPALGDASRPDPAARPHIPLPSSGRRASA